MDSDRQEYRELWIAVLTHLLCWPDDRINAWLESKGEYLLNGPDSFLFHEEPWYWICSDVVAEFVSQGSVKKDGRAFEAAVWFALADQLSLRQDWAEVDWEALREKCRLACRLS